MTSSCIHENQSFFFFGTPPILPLVSVYLVLSMESGNPVTGAPMQHTTQFSSTNSYWKFMNLINFFEILLNQTKIRLYLPISD